MGRKHFLLQILPKFCILLVKCCLLTVLNVSILLWLNDKIWKQRQQHSILSTLNSRLAGKWLKAFYSSSDIGLKPSQANDDKWWYSLEKWKGSEKKRSTHWRFGDTTNIDIHFFMLSDHHSSQNTIDCYTQGISAFFSPKLSCGNLKNPMSSSTRKLLSLQVVAGTQTTR